MYAHTYNRPKTTLAKGSAALVNNVADGFPLQHVLRHLCSASAEENNYVVIKRVADVVCAAKCFKHALLASGLLLPVTVVLDSTPQALQFAAWLAEYGRICHSISIEAPNEYLRGFKLSQEQLAEVNHAIAAALAKAAQATPQGLQLQHCSLQNVDSSASPILKQLPHRHLTSLCMNLAGHQDVVPPGASISDSCYTSISSALAQLTGLRSVSLSFKYSTNDSLLIDPLVEPLSTLTNLTYLSLPQLKTFQGMQHLPGSLLELHFERVIGQDDDISLELRHLTALTGLSMDRFARMYGHYILPSNTLQLLTGSVVSVRCLLPLKQLQELHICFLSSQAMAADELKQLSALTTLQYVGFRYDWANAANDAAEGWASVPSLSSLSLVEGWRTLTVHSMQQLTRLSKLAALSLSMSGMESTPAFEQFAASLCHMTSLTYLSLGNVTWQQDASAGANHDTQQHGTLLSVVQALQQLPLLRVVYLSGVKIWRGEAEYIAKLTQVTKLHMRCCGLEDASLLQIGMGLRNSIHYLGFSDNKDITDAVLPVLHQVMPSVWDRSSIHGTSMTYGEYKQYVESLTPA